MMLSSHYEWGHMHIMASQITSDAGFHFIFEMYFCEMLLHFQRPWSTVWSAVLWKNRSWMRRCVLFWHYSDVIIKLRASQITGVSIVCWTLYSGADKRKHQRPTSMAFVRGIHMWPVEFLHKGPVTWKIFPFDDVIIKWDDLFFHPSIHLFEI